MNSKHTIGIVDPDYVIEAAVVDLHQGTGDMAAEFSPYGKAGATGHGLILRWTGKSGGVLHVIVTADASKPAAYGLCGVRAGDVLRVEGHAVQLLWPGVIGEVVLMHNPHDIEIVRRADQKTIEQPDCAPGNRPAPGQAKGMAQ